MSLTVTMQKLEEMRLSGFTRAYREITDNGKDRDFTTDELIAHLVQAEWDERYNRKLHRLTTNARFRYKASMEEIDYVFQRNLDKNVMLRLSTCDWITKRQNVIITGSTGLGKASWHRLWDSRLVNMATRSFTGTALSCSMS